SPRRGVSPLRQTRGACLKSCNRRPNSEKLPNEPDHERAETIERGRWRRCGKNGFGTWGSGISSRLLLGRGSAGVVAAGRAASARNVSFEIRLPVGCRILQPSLQRQAGLSEILLPETLV